VKKEQKKLVLNCDTVRNLGAPALREAAAGSGNCSLGCTIYVSCGCTVTCLTAGCPTRVQNRTNLC
jgi:hypothetical protein